MKTNTLVGNGPVKIAINEDLEARDLVRNLDIKNQLKNIQVLFAKDLSQETIEESIANIKRPFSILIDLNTSENIIINGPGTAGFTDKVTDFVKTKRSTSHNWYIEKYELPVTVIGKNNINWKEYLKVLLNYSNGKNG